MRSTRPGLTIGALAKATGIGIEAIRFYQHRGLLPVPPRELGQIRRYGNAAVERLHFVKRAQRAGFSLDEVASLLQLDDGTHCAEAAVIAAARLAEVRVRLADLQHIEAALGELVTRCSGRRGRVSCPLIAALHTDPVRAPRPVAIKPPRRSPRASADTPRRGAGRGGRETPR